MRVSTIVRDIDDSKCVCQDDIRLILLLMYTTIIMWSIIIGLSNCPGISPQRCTSHTCANEDTNEYTKVYFGCPHLRTVRITSFSSSRRLADSRTPCPRAGNLRLRRWSVRTPQRLSMLWKLRGGTERGKWIIPGPLGFSYVLKMNTKTKPTSKLNCRGIIFIYKLGNIKSAKRDIL